MCKFMFWSFGFRAFEFVSGFVFRIWDFEFREPATDTIEVR